jgi:Domain of Unknown Function (DUF928)
METLKFSQPSPFSLLGAIALLTPLTLPHPTQAATFTPPPGSVAPSNATGGASRGSFFTPTGAPQVSTGGASRGQFFAPNGAPQTATGGASRGQFFAPNGAPQTAMGGASRGRFFAPVGAPQTAIGGASRGRFFAPVGAPQTAIGGASRGQFFVPSGAPQTAIGGASRGQFFAPSGAPQTTGGGASRGDFLNSNGAPQTTVGGGSRIGTFYLNANSLSQQFALIALLPQTYHGTTISEQPTFLVYLPRSNAQDAIFSLKDKEGNLTYQMVLPVTGKEGIIAIKLPKTAPILQVGKDYQWFFALKIDGQLSPSTPYVDGWVQRIQPPADLAKFGKTDSPLEQANDLAKRGIWYDSAAMLAELRSRQPSSELMAKEWSEFLTSVGLTDMETAPISIN